MSHQFFTIFQVYPINYADIFKCRFSKAAFYTVMMKWTFRRLPQVGLVFQINQVMPNFECKLCNVPITIYVFDFWIQCFSFCPKIWPIFPFIEELYVCLLIWWISRQNSPKNRFHSSDWMRDHSIIIESIWNPCFYWQK